MRLGASVTARGYPGRVDLKLPRVSDTLIAAAMLALAIIVAVDQGGEPPAGAHPYDAFGYILLVLQVGPLAYRQRYPVAVLWMSMVTWTVASGVGYVDTPATLVVFVALYGVAAYMPRRLALRHGAAAALWLLGWTAIGIAATDYVEPGALLASVLAVVVPMTIGMVDYRRSERLTELELASQRRRQAERVAANDAVRAERARIARELHDVVAHEMTVMTLHAEGARRRAGDDPVLSEALETISDSGRKGLAEMQRMIGVLRTSEREAEDEAAELTGRTRGAAIGPAVGDEFSPVPSLATLPALVEQVEEAGMPVELSIEGTAHVPAGVELSAYRIVQESLTNALKYAGPGARARVQLTRRAGELSIIVEDDGRGVIAEATRSSGGHGIAGMRERVQQLGGTMDHGPRSGGGFRVEAHLPASDDQVRAAAPRASTPKGAK